MVIRGRHRPINFNLHRGQDSQNAKVSAGPHCRLLGGRGYEMRYRFSHTRSQGAIAPNSHNSAEKYDLVPMGLSSTTCLRACEVGVCALGIKEHERLSLGWPLQALGGGTVRYDSTI